METVLNAILSYLISLAANFRSDELIRQHQAEVTKVLGDEEMLRKALGTTRSLSDDLAAVCAALARDFGVRGGFNKNRQIAHLFVDADFQANLLEWLMNGGIEEGRAARERILRRLEEVLLSSEVSPEHVAMLKSMYFESIEKTIYSNPTLAHWRHQLSLQYLRDQVAELRRLAKEAAGVYTPERLEIALASYCQKALSSWDIIDLSNLPEGDIQIATQKLLLRQLYMPLRVEVERKHKGDRGDAQLEKLEERYEARRRREVEGGMPYLVSARNANAWPIGKHLEKSPRLVVLGEPGGGKTTLLRWMATAYLLKRMQDSAFGDLPDTATLPVREWIPVLIRCRDLGDADLCRSFPDFLSQHLNKSDLLPDEARVMRSVILDRIAKGEALLLVDGLDEITNPQVRAQFCQELERTAVRYPDAPIVITSRIVGYRDMPYRMGSGFEHAIIAELDRDDQDLFAKRWVNVTEQHLPEAEKEKRVGELLDALHSSNRIERLAGNPMLLTTLALVKRKVGKLPNRRNKLYAEAVSVLLNWNPRLYQAIEEDEAIPQLEYLAYEMCRRGVQRLTDDDVLELLERLRHEYPNVRAIRRRNADEFLALLEARSSILIRAGGRWHQETKREAPLWEFRHLTFQEYLAARAILDGRYPERNKANSIAMQVAPLAGSVSIPTPQDKHAPIDEVEVPESWREALRLLVADCKDDDVDDVLMAIVTPLENEDVAQTERPRSILAALCLADEPNASEEMAVSILESLAKSIGEEDGNGRIRSSLDRAAVEVAGSIWATHLKRVLIDEFYRRTPMWRWHPGGLAGVTAIATWRRTGKAAGELFTDVGKWLASPDERDKAIACLTVMEAAFEGDISCPEEIPRVLIDLAARSSPPLCQAAVWALGWLAIGGTSKTDQRPQWTASQDEVEMICAVLERAPSEEIGTRRWIVNILGAAKDSRALPVLTLQLRDEDDELRRATVKAISGIGTSEALRALWPMLDDPAEVIRESAVVALGREHTSEHVALVMRMLKDTDAGVRSAAAEVLREYRAQESKEALMEALEDDNPGVRTDVIQALATIGGMGVNQALVRKLSDRDVRVRQAAIRGIGRSGDSGAIALLLPMLTMANRSVRLSAAMTLSHLGDPRGRRAVEVILSSRSSATRRAAVGEAARLMEDVQMARLLSEDLDGIQPWIDPAVPVAAERVRSAATALDIDIEHATKLYLSIASLVPLRIDSVK